MPRATAAACTATAHHHQHPAPADHGCSPFSSTVCSTAELGFCAVPATTHLCTAGKESYQFAIRRMIEPASHPEPAQSCAHVVHAIRLARPLGVGPLPSIHALLPLHRYRPHGFCNAHTPPQPPTHSNATSVYDSGIRCICAHHDYEAIAATTLRCTSVSACDLTLANPFTFDCQDELLQSTTNPVRIVSQPRPAMDCRIWRNMEK